MPTYLPKLIAQAVVTAQVSISLGRDSYPSSLPWEKLSTKTSSGNRKILSNGRFNILSPLHRLPFQGLHKQEAAITYGCVGWGSSDLMLICTVLVKNVKIIKLKMLVICYYPASGQTFAQIQPAQGCGCSYTKVVIPVIQLL